MAGVTLATAAGAAAVAGAVTVVTTPLMGWVGRRTNIVDHPGALKVHSRSVPYLGGVAVQIGLVVAMLTAGDRKPEIWIPAALALLLGVVDDWRGLPPWARLAGEIPVGIAVALVVDTRLPGPLGPIVVVIATVALINAVNMLDGLDGLGAGVCLASAVGFVALGLGGFRAAAAALAGALAGFLVWNRSPARIYLGDGGSYLLGTMLATLLAGAWRPHLPIDRAVLALALVAVPLFELATTVVRRLRARTPLTEGDRDHTYDRLLRRGASVARVSATMAGVQAGIAAIAIAVAFAIAQ